MSTYIFSACIPWRSGGDESKKCVHWSSCLDPNRRSRKWSWNLPWLYHSKTSVRTRLLKNRVSMVSSWVIYHSLIVSYRPSPGLRPKFATVADCQWQLKTALNRRTRKFYTYLEFYVYHPRLLRAWEPFCVKTSLKRVIHFFCINSGLGRFRAFPPTAVQPLRDQGAANWVLIEASLLEERWKNCSG